MRRLAMVVPYYDNPRMLRRQRMTWAMLRAHVQQHVSVVVVDDGSPRWPLRRNPMGDIPDPAWMDIDYFRIGVDVRWNWIAARNLGVYHARADWVLMTDMDHVVPEDTWVDLMARKLDERVAYRFRRLDAVTLDFSRTVFNPKIHPNTWLLHRSLFNRAGGYDERFSGYYGSDGEFRERVRQTSRLLGGAGIVDLPCCVIRVSRELVPDASTTTYTRKDPKIDKGQIRRIISERGSARPLNLTFPWERLT